MAKSILITGGTGSFGQKFVELLLSTNEYDRICIYSRDEHKQLEMEQRLNDSRLRFFLGDIRDLERLRLALRGINEVVHAAAYKQVQKAEYDPSECVKTNIRGSDNVIRACIDNGVKKCLLISTDKAVQPINLYGSTKMVAERLFIAANSYASTLFAVSRYGNVAGTRSTVVPIFLAQRSSGVVTVTNTNATRFWITLEEANKFVLNVLSVLKPGRVYTPKMDSVKIMDIKEAVAPECKVKIIGNRPGDKLHEVLVTEEEMARVTSEYGMNVINPVGSMESKSGVTEYNSSQGKILSVEEIKGTLKGLVYA